MYFKKKDISFTSLSYVLVNRILVMKISDVLYGVLIWQQNDLIFIRDKLQYNIAVHAKHCHWDTTAGTKSLKFPW